MCWFGCAVKKATMGKHVDDKRPRKKTYACGMAVGGCLCVCSLCSALFVRLPLLGSLCSALCRAPCLCCPCKVSTEMQFLIGLLILWGQAQASTFAADLEWVPSKRYSLYRISTFEPVDAQCILAAAAQIPLQQPTLMDFVWVSGKDRNVLCGVAPRRMTRHTGMGKCVHYDGNRYALSKTKIAANREWWGPGFYMITQACAHAHTRTSTVSRCSLVASWPRAWVLRPLSLVRKQTCV